MKACHIGLLVLALTGCRAQSATWEDLSREATQSGLQSAQVKPLLERCRARGWNPDTTRSAVRFAIEASRQGVPCDPILDRIEEGVTKGIEPARVTEAAQRRYESLARADTLLHDTLGKSVPGHSGIILSLSRALESGLTDQAMSKLLRDGADARPGPLMAVLDAGELLRHAGFAEADSIALMQDCLERNVGRGQVMRLIQRACEQKEGGMDLSEIRKELSSSLLPPTGGGGGHRRGRNR